MVDARNDLDRIPGGVELCARIGVVPTFADATLLDLQLSVAGQASIVLRTRSIDTNGRFRDNDPLLVRFDLSGVSRVELSEFAKFAFVDVLKVESADDGYLLSWEAGAGVQGSIKADQIMVGFEGVPV